MIESRIKLFMNFSDFELEYSYELYPYEIKLSLLTNNNFVIGK